MLKKQLLSKQGEVMTQLSRILCGISEKEILPTNQALAQELSAGAGTIQAALKRFEEDGVLQLKSHGHQGTVAEAIDYVKLFRYDASPWLMGEMPLLYSQTLEGLATGIYRNFEKKDVPLKLSYVRGGKVRIKYLLEGKMDFAVCSAMAARTAVKEYPELEILCEFGSNTYVSISGIIFSRKGCTHVEDGMKLGVDEDSVDHELLNQLAAGNHKVEFIKLRYSEIIPKLIRGEIDATVWAFDNIHSAGIENCTLVSAQGRFKEALSPAEDAVILVKKGNGIRNVMKAILDTGLICETQKGVLEQKIIPSY